MLFWAGCYAMMRKGVVMPFRSRFVFHKSLWQTSAYFIDPLFRLRWRYFDIGRSIIFKKKPVYVWLAATIRVIMLPLYVPNQLVVNHSVQIVAISLLYSREWMYLFPACHFPTKLILWLYTPCLQAGMSSLVTQSLSTRPHRALQIILNWCIIDGLCHIAALVLGMELEGLLCWYEGMGCNWGDGFLPRAEGSICVWILLLIILLWSLIR
jgi:hypothetical protein